MNAYQLLYKYTRTFAALSIVAAIQINTKAANSDNYKLSTGDTIGMTILQEPDMQVKARIAKDGSVQFPLIGHIEVAGNNLQELQTSLFELYNRDYFVNPQISLTILDYRERRVRVRGRVGRPGFVVIPPEEEFTLLDAIAAAGDISSGGNERKVELHRIGDNGQEQVRVFDLSKSIGNNESAKIVLKVDDIVLVPEKLF